MLLAIDFFPHLTRGEGFFLALFRKKDGSDKQDFSAKKANSKILFDVSKYYDAKGMFTFLQNDYIITIRNQHREILDYLVKNIKFVRKGVLVGKALHNDLIPSHELALYHKNHYSLHKIDLDIENAISYLQKEPFHSVLTSKGWHLVTYEHIGIG